MSAKILHTRTKSESAICVPNGAYIRAASFDTRTASQYVASVVPALIWVCINAVRERITPKSTGLRSCGKSCSVRSITAFQPTSLDAKPHFWTELERRVKRDEHIGAKALAVPEKKGKSQSLKESLFRQIESEPTHMYVIEPVSKVS